MRKFFLLMILFFAAVIAIAALYSYRIEFVKYYKELLGIKTHQYFGATVDMSQILPESKYYVKNDKGEDLITIAANLGMNTLRITNITSPNDGKITSSYTHQQWKEVLDEMKNKHMHAVILVESNSADSEFFSETINDAYPAFVKNYVVDSDLCSFSNILAVDIRNEPILDQNNLAKLKEASQIVKSSCPSLKVTIGSWKLGDNWHDPKGAGVLNDIVDIHSVHVYGFDKPIDGPYPDPYKLTTAYLNEIRKYSDKPILIEEFGAGNGSGLTDQDTLGSPGLQKNVYEGVFKAVADFKDKDAIGALAYLLLPRSGGTDGWSISTDSGNTFLPAAYTFKAYRDN